MGHEGQFQEYEVSYVEGLEEIAEVRFENWKRASEEASVWKRRCEHAEKDLKRCQDALMRHELDRLEDTSG
jgi:hypothetical protein